MEAELCNIAMYLHIGDKCTNAVTSFIAIYKSYKPTYVYSELVHS